ncbi:MAG: type II toxin-antitoxin system VapC family toxin, partial [Acidimicrobiales bacterium]
MIVVDASAAVSALLNAGPARQTLSEQPIHAPHLIDTEVASALRRQVANNHIDAATARTALDRWRRLALARYPVVGLLERV